MRRAFSVLTLKALDDDAREFSGTASTPAADLQSDELVPGGAIFALPLPLLMEHRRSEPIGHVTHATVSDAGILVKCKLVKVAEPGPLRDRLQTAWLSIRERLVAGLSLGFQPLKTEPLRSGGTRFLAYRVLEISTCLIPTNTQCTITSVKAMFAANRSAHPGAIYLDNRHRTQRPVHRVVRL